MRGVILSAGEGSRLRPFTSDKPKPMVCAANKPIMQHAVEALVANGIKDIVIVAGYHRERIQSHFGDGKKFGARVTYAFQDVLSSTARALATAPAPREPFLVLSGDNVVDAALVKSLLGAPGAGPALAIHRSDHPHRYGVITLDGSRVQAVVEKPRDPQSEWVNTGVYRLTPEFHARATKATEQPFEHPPGLPDLLQAAIDEGVRVEAVKTDALWSDAVYPWDLLRVHADILRNGRTSQPVFPGVHVEQPVLVGEGASIGPGTILNVGTCIGNNVNIGPNCVLENCVIYDDVQIGASSILRNTIIGEGTRIAPRFTAISDACDIRTTDGWHHLDDFGSIIGEDARIGGNVVLLPGTVLGNRARVAHAKTVHGNIEDNASVV
ncbi:MAG: sugar phosphate nucleotidyltransferase [Candidatus Thermoplasmatota archaeon]